jgi:hypothetical protein
MHANDINNEACRCWGSVRVMLLLIFLISKVTFKDIGNDNWSGKNISEVYVTIPPRDFWISRPWNLSPYFNPYSNGYPYKVFICF